MPMHFKTKEGIQSRNLELGFGEDDRDYSIVGYIFNDLKVKKLKLITNNPKK